MPHDEESTDLVVYADLETIGQVADDYASQETFAEYRRAAQPTPCAASMTT
jgi:hypothetical protein